MTKHLNSDPIRTVGDLIAANGGETVLAHNLGVTVETVQHWIELGETPVGLHMRLFARALVAGRRFEPSGIQRVFGLAPHEARALCRAEMEA